MKNITNIILLMLSLCFFSLNGYSLEETGTETLAVEKKKNDSQPTITNNNNSIPQNTEEKLKNVFTIGEIVVRDKSIANIEDATTTTEITAEDITRRGEKTLSDSLQMVPGIQVSSHRKGNRQFYLRGYDMQKVALLVDGIPVTDAYGGNMDIENIGVANISKIIINRGVCSALYGTRGVVGSINIITQRPEKLTAQGSFDYGFFGQYNCNVSVGMPIKLPVGELYFWLTGTYDRSEGYEISHSLNKSEREHWFWLLSRYDLSGFDFQDLYDTNSAIQSYINDSGTWEHVEHNQYKVSAKIGYEIMKGLEIGVTGSYNNNKKRNSTYFSAMLSSYNEETQQWAPPLASDALGNMSTYWPEYYDCSVSPYIYFSRKNFDLKINGFFYQQSNTLAAYKDVEENILKWGTEETNTWSIWTSQAYGVNIYPSYKFTNWNKLNGAVSIRFDNHLKEEEARNGATTVLAVFGDDPFKTQFIEALMFTLALEDEMNFFNNKLQLSVGISYDMQEILEYKKRLKTASDGTAYASSDKMEDRYIAKDNSLICGTRDSFNPVIGILYEPLKDFLKLRAAAAMKTSFPTLEIYSKTFEHIDETADGSRDVKIDSERSYNGNAGIEFILLNKKLNLRADYFFSKYEDKIERYYNKDIEDFIYINIDSAVLHGIETIFSGNFASIGKIVDIDFSLSYTFIFARNLTDKHNTDINKGDKFEKTPEHKIIADISFNFISGTNLSIFGQMSFCEIQYTMASLPAQDDPFSTEYFYMQKLHDPIMLHVKISQTIIDHMEVYLQCKNILDDYNSDPLNPGPGRQFYLGLKGYY